MKPGHLDLHRRITEEGNAGWTMILRVAAERLRADIDAAREAVERLKAPTGKVLSCGHRDDEWIKLEADLARVRAALETAANRLDIAASVIRSGAKFARWADEARAALEGRG